MLGYKSPRASAVATKYCTVNNEWYRNNDGVFWSNYTECTPPPGHFITAVKNLEFTHSEYGKFCNSTILEVSLYNNYNICITKKIIINFYCRNGCQ